MSIIPVIAETLQQKLAKQETQNFARPAKKQAILVVKDNQSFGTAFFAEVAGETVAVSCRHVFLEMDSPRILDLNNHSYLVNEILEVPDRDAVILGLTPVNGHPLPEPLKLAEDISNLPAGTQLNAWGNSLGDGVLNQQNGELQAIGPTKLEFTIPVVPGDSGGPVLSESGEVVGMTAFLHQLDDKKIYQDSRFESQITFAGGKPYVRPAIRRIGVRLDNIDWSKLHKVNPGKLAADRALVEELKGFILQLKRDASPEERQALYAGFEDALHKGFHHQFTSLYYRDVYFEGRGILENYFSGNQYGNQIMRLLQEQPENFTIRDNPRGRLVCPFCRGIGEIQRLKRNPAYDGHHLRANTLRLKETCQNCLGTGFRNIEPPRLLKVNPSLQKEIRQILLAASFPFNQMFLGKDFAGEIRPNPYYRRQNNRNLIAVLNNGFGKSYIFRGNHVSKLVSYTILTENFGVLTEIKLLLPPGLTETQKNEINVLKGVCPKELILTQNISRLADLPCLPAGALLDPAEFGFSVRSMNYYTSGTFQTNTAKAPGFYLIARLPAAADLNNLDYHKLAGAKEKSIRK